MKYLLIAIVILLGGCGDFENKKHLTDGTGSFSKICVDNVYYLYGGHKLSVWINQKTLNPSNCGN